MRRFYTFPFWQGTTLSRELRLVFEATKKVEVLGEKPLETLYKEQLRSLLLSLSPEQRLSAQGQEKNLLLALGEKMKEAPLAGQVEKLRAAREALAANITETRDIDALDRKILEEVTREESTPKEDPSWFPKSVDPREWTPKQIATLSAVTLGGIGLFALFRRWRNRRQEKKEREAASQPVQQEKVQKGGLLRHLAWIPGLGLVALAAYAGHKFMQKFDPYAHALEFIEKKMQKKYEELKNSIPFIGEKKKYGLPSEEAKHAEAAYAKSRTLNKEVRKTFGLKDGEINPEFEAFAKEMQEKYEVKEENGVKYARADVALENYETQIEVALKELLRWIEGHPLEIAAIGYASYRLGILDIDTILKGAGSIGGKAAAVAKKMAEMGLHHPFLSVLGVGASFLAARAAITQSKIYLPENFGEMAKAAANNVMMLGPASDAVNAVFASTQEKWKDLMAIEGDFTKWAKKSLEDLASKIIERAPEASGRTKEETIVERNKSCMEDLAQVLISTQASVMASTAGVEARMDEKYVAALQRLEEFQKIFIAERGEKIAQSDEPVRALRRLDEALRVVHIELAVRGGVVRWKREQGEEVDLSVDPALLDLEIIHDLSEKLREENLSDGSYILLRAITDYREKFEGARERGFPGNGIVAVFVGHLIYFTDWENQKEFWVAPLALMRDLVGGEEWTNKVANLESAAVNSAIISANIGLFARLVKRLPTGGTLGFKRNWSTVTGLFHNVNPFTCPIKVLKDIAGGYVDLEAFVALRKYGERISQLGGRYINTVLDSVHVRPQWIGTIAHSMDRNELLYVARQLGKVGSIEHLDIPHIKETLKHWIISELINKEARAGSIAAARVGGVIDGAEIFEAVADWSASQTRLSRFAVGGEKLLTQGLNPQEWWAEGVQRAPKWKQRFFGKKAPSVTDIPKAPEIPSEKPKLRVVSPEDIPDIPDSAKRVIARNAANETELMQMRKGVSALAKMGVGIDALLLVYETYQVASMWREIGKLEEVKSLSAFLEEATEKKKFVAWRHTEALAGSAIGTGLGTVHVLTGKLAIVGGVAGTFAIVAIPIALGIRAGMYESLADFELRNKIRLRDRLEGYDTMVTKKTQFDELRELGGIPLTLRFGAGISTATVEDFEKENQSEREEIFLAMVIRELRDATPRSYDILLTKLGPAGISELRGHELSRKVLLPFIGKELLRVAFARGPLKPEIQQELQKLNIKKGWFGTYITEEEIRAITFDSAQILEAWVSRADEALPEISEAHAIVEHLRSEKLAETRKRMHEAFGSVATVLMEKPAHELIALRQEHANVLVDIHYYDHSALLGIVKRRQTVPFAGDRETGVMRIRERLDVLNDYLQVTVHAPHLRLEPLQKFGREERHITAQEGFMQAGNYHVNEVYVAADHHRGSEPARDLLFLSDNAMRSTSLGSIWREKAVHRYRELLQRFENVSGEERKAA